ncbi:MAG: hypothetical protein RL757_2423 [Bacteroidota bacterium]|jgi:hypothetical protein
MYKKIFLLSLFGLAIIASCEKNQPAPTPVPATVEVELPDTNNYNMPGALPCFTCANDTISEIYRDVPAIVTKAVHDPIRGIDASTVFSISTGDVIRGTGGYKFDPDSILVPCKKLPWGYDSVGKKVKISGELRSCGRLFTHASLCFFAYGRTFVLTKIKPF